MASAWQAHTHGRGAHTRAAHWGESRTESSRELCVWGRERRFVCFSAHVDPLFFRPANPSSPFPPSIKAMLARSQPRVVAPGRRSVVVSAVPQPLREG